LQNRINYFYQFFFNLWKKIASVAWQINNCCKILKFVGFSLDFR
jgi:hypothetical protein